MNVDPYVASPQPGPPLTPYAGTSGWSGTETSKVRAETEDASGITGQRQRATMELVRWHAAHGMTVKELREQTGRHHGQASSALTVLHKEGLLVRLAETRDRCKVYVTPEWAHGREAEPYQPRRAGAKAVAEERTRILQRIEEEATTGDLWVLIDTVRNIVLDK